MVGAISECLAEDDQRIADQKRYEDTLEKAARAVIQPTLQSRAHVEEALQEPNKKSKSVHYSTM